jgi:hypothetical protein
LGDLGGGKINSLPAIIQLNLASFPKLESIIILSLKNSTKRPNECQLSILLPCNKYEDIQDDHIELAGIHIVHKCLTIATQFHTSRFFTPKPPSSLSKQTVFQATFALPNERSLPFHKKDLKKRLFSQ